MAYDSAFVRVSVPGRCRAMSQKSVSQGIDSSGQGETELKKQDV